MSLSQNGSYAPTLLPSYPPTLLLPPGTRLATNLAVAMAGRRRRVKVLTWAGAALVTVTFSVYVQMSTPAGAVRVGPELMMTLVVAKPVKSSIPREVPLV